jgi:glutathione synthase/RimK-type ligase-like ATP-grasp enzyme
VLVKRYRSSVSQGVFLESDSASLRARMRILFENSGYLDNILLIQSYVLGPEYRVVASQGELLLAYEKQCDEGLSPDDLNPLHQTTGRAVKVKDLELLGAMEELTQRVSEVIDLGFYAIDLIDGRDGLSILELNPNPFCYFYNRDNGREDFVSIYEFLLDKYLLRRAGTASSLTSFARNTG